MHLKSRLFYFLIIFCVMLVASARAFADTIRLRDGSVIKGRVVGFRDGQFVVVIGDGTRSRQMTFFSDEIETIEFEATALSATGSAPPIRPNNPVSTNANRPNVTPTPGARTNGDNANNNVIVVGRNDPNNSASAQIPPKVIAADVSKPTDTSVAADTSAQTNTGANNAGSARPKAIQINVKVLADNTSNGWTNAGWVVRKGQKIRITGNGRVSLGNGNYTTAAGIASLEDKNKLMSKEPTGELIAVVGDDNNEFIPVGASKEFTATRDGALFLGINEGMLDDNSGAFDVVIEIDPTSNN